MTDILKSDEKVVIACEVMEGSLAGRWTKRHLVLTTLRLINFTEDMQPNRVIDVFKITSVVKKQGVDLDDCFDFLIEVQGEADLLLYSKKRQEIIWRIRACISGSSDKTLAVEQTSQKLNQYMATKKQDRGLSLSAKSDQIEDQQVELIIEEVGEDEEDEGLNFDNLLCKTEQAIEKKYTSWMDRGSSGGSGGGLKKLAE